MTVYQPSTDTLWEFERLTHLRDHWQAVRGGIIADVSHSPGYYRNRAVRGRILEQAQWGASATSLPLIAGTILISDLERGYIDHTLAIALPQACQGTFAWPAQRSDGKDPSINCVPEGAHMRLDPHLRLSSLHLPHITYEIALAAQRYGLIVRDTTKYDVAFFAQDPTPTAHNPYIGVHGLYDNESPYKFLRRFPWSHLQLLKMHLCNHTPCQLP
jgi:hypothetical protein